jgi:protein-S-isoprenylcysteine O-methyltransferase Ste14
MGMGPLVLHDTLAAILFWGSYAAWFAIESALRQRGSGQGRESRDPTALLVMLSFPVWMVVGALVADGRPAPIGSASWWPVVSGLVLVWLGIALRVWSILTLGRFFKLTVVIQDDHRVVERGPYRLLRHPSYTGALIIAAGFGLAEADLVSLAIVLVGVLVPLLIRIRVEERTLLSELGDAYADYARRTARLVPGVY